ncbi:MAG: DUF5655 domain-containing protein [Lysobacterales bacterium]
MSNVDKALETQLRNIQTKTGKSLDQIYAAIRESGLAKHGQIRDLLKQMLEIGHDDANTLAQFFLKGEQAAGSQENTSTPVDVLGEIYAGAKSNLRPIHDKLMTAIVEFRPLEVAPKKGYVSLRGDKQFAMVGPATQTRVDVGLNLKTIAPTVRLVAVPPGGMCQFKVKVESVKDVDKELIGWIRQAYDAAGKAGAK